MIFEFDLGNSRLKWRMLSAAGEVLSQGAVASNTGQISGLISELAPQPDRVRGGCVAAAELESTLAQSVRDSWGVEVEFARSGAEAAGVRNGYEVPADLGVDRWLALIAAFQLCRRPVLVADAGSALTIDLVDGGGQHLGGYIVPGRRLMEQSLHRDTARVRIGAAADATPPGPGCSTAAAVGSGAQLGLWGALLAARTEAERLLLDFDLVVTGGDGAWLLQRLTGYGAVRRSLLVPDLVLDGLAWVLP